MNRIKIDGFNIIKMTRKNSATITFKARQSSLDRYVDILILNPELAKEPSAVKHFVDIARAAAKLKHSNILQIYDVIESDELPPYAIMEHVDGPSVADLINIEGALSPKGAMDIALSTASALAHAWKTSRLINRNVKPSEILIDKDGTVKMVDFSKAALLGEPDFTDPEEGFIVGTPHYLSPEQARGSSSTDFRSDVYSLGATVYHMVTGHPPFADDTELDILRKQINETIPHPKSVLPDIPGGLAMMIRRMMMKAPENRTESWDEIISDLQRIRNKRPPLQRKSDSEGISTVRPFNPGHYTRKPEAPTPKRETGGGFAGLLLRLLLLAWLAALACWRWHNPDAPLPFSGNGDHSSLTNRVSNTQNNIPGSQKETVPHSNTPIPHPIRAMDTPNTENPPETAPTPIVPSELRRHIIDALTKEDPSAAISAVKSASLPHCAEIEKILASLKNTNETVIKYFIHNANRRITVSTKTGQRTIIPKYASGERLHVSIVTETGTQPATFNIGILPASERILRLPQPETYEDYAMRFMLSMAAGDIEDAARWAEKTGPLKPLISPLEIPGGE